MLLTSKGGAGVAGSAIVVLASTLSARARFRWQALDSFSCAPAVVVCFVPVNVLGNALATIVVSRWERALDVKACTRNCTTLDPPL